MRNDALTTFAERLRYRRAGGVAHSPAVVLGQVANLTIIRVMPANASGVEPPLEQIAAFLLAKVDHPRVASMGLSDHRGQAVSRRSNKTGRSDGDESPLLRAVDYRPG